MKDLFPQKDWLAPTESVPPVIWIKELRIHKKLSSSSEDLVRKIDFQTGLNIIWAEPAEREEKDKNKRGKGHSAGKTTLCRLIRYALGEVTYGKEDFVRRLRRHDELYAPWITAEVVISGESWAVARPLFTSPDESCLRGGSIDDFFESSDEQRSQIEDYEAAVEEAVQQNFAIHHFKADNVDEIAWKHTMEWLTRDQECHMSGIFKWRNTDSQSGSPELPKEKAQLLTRTILDITNSEERDELQTRKGHIAEKASLRNTLEYNALNREETIESLQKTILKGKDIPTHIDEIFISYVVDLLDTESAKINAKHDKKIEDLKLGKLSKNRDDAIEHRAICRDRAQKMANELAVQAKALEKLKKAENPSEQDLKELLDGLPPLRSHCQVPAVHAIFQCPIHRKHRAEKAGVVSPDLENLDEQLEQMATEAEKEIGLLEQDVAVVNKTFADAEASYLSATSVLDAKKEEKQEIEEDRQEGLESISDLSSATRLLNSRTAKIQKCEKSMASCDEKITKSDSLIKEYQDWLSKRQSRLGIIFNALVQEIKGEDANGELQFTPQNIEALIDYKGPRDSGAYKALTCILFDYTALIARLHGIGNHPGFLLHDSPREAEMEPSLFLPVIDFMKKLDGQIPESFQYIVTTTDTLSKELLESDNIVLHLDGAEESGRLLCADLE